MLRRFRRFNRWGAISAVACSMLAATAGADSPVGWRGDGSGLFLDAVPPSQWSKETNIVWKTVMPGRSISSPIVVGDRVFSVAQPAELICLDANSGKILWQRSHAYREVLGDELGKKVEADLIAAKETRQQIDQLRREFDEARKKSGEKDDTPAAKAAREAHEKEVAPLEEKYRALTGYPPVPEGTPGNTTSTPISDGKSIWTVFATGIVSSHELDGTRNWARFVAAPGDRHSASPLHFGDRLVVDLGSLYALDAKTGETLWKAEISSRAGTPVAARLGETDVIVTPSGAIVRLADGEILGKELFSLNYCSPVVAGDVVYAVENGKTKAIRLTLDNAGKLEPKQLWETRGARDHRLGSPVVHEGLLYSATENGILDVLDIESGELVYRQRLPRSEGRIDPSLAIAGDRLFISTTRGQTLVVKPGRKFEELARNQLGEELSSSPAFHGQRIFLRTEKQLYCLGEKVVSGEK